MKSLTYFLLILICLGTYTCKDKDKNETTTESSLGAEKADLAMADVYQCPMDCEDGKTYEEAGDCPKCGMELKKKETESKEEDSSGMTDEHEGHDHD